MADEFDLSEYLDADEKPAQGEGSTAAVLAAPAKPKKGRGRPRKRRRRTRQVSDALKRRLGIVGKLSPKNASMMARAKAFDLYLDRGPKWAEIGEELGYSAGWARTNVRRVMEAAGRELRERGLDVMAGEGVAQLERMQQRVTTELEKAKGKEAREWLKVGLSVIDHRLKLAGSYPGDRLKIEDATPERQPVVTDAEAGDRAAPAPGVSVVVERIIERMTYPARVPQSAQDQGTLIGKGESLEGFKRHFTRKKEQLSSTPES